MESTISKTLSLSLSILISILSQPLRLPPPPLLPPVAASPMPPLSAHRPQAPLHICRPHPLPEPRSAVSVSPGSREVPLAGRFASLGAFGGRGGGGGGGVDGEDWKVKSVVDGAEEASGVSSDVIILDVGGMTCGGCAAGMKRILENQHWTASGICCQCKSYNWDVYCMACI